MPDDNQDHQSHHADFLARLTADMKTAMKSGDKGRLQVIRMLVSEARAADLQKPPTTPPKAVEAYHKKLVKSRDDYADDPERLAALDAELKVVEDYVPKKTSSAETGVLVDDFLARHPEFAGSDVGKATGLFMREHGGNADAKAANARIREVLFSR